MSRNEKSITFPGCLLGPQKPEPIVRRVGGGGTLFKAKEKQKKKRKKNGGIRVSDHGFISRVGQNGSFNKKTRGSDGLESSGNMSVVLLSRASSTLISQCVLSIYGGSYSGFGVILVLPWRRNVDPNGGSNNGEIN